MYKNASVFHISSIPWLSLLVFFRPVSVCTLASPSLFPPQDIEVDVEFHSTTAAGAEGVPALPGVAPGATAADLADDVVVAVGGDGSFHNVLNATIQQLGAAEARRQV